jgi:hypothetical protein
LGLLRSPYGFGRVSRWLLGDLPQYEALFGGDWRGWAAAVSTIRGLDAVQNHLYGAGHMVFNPRQCLSGHRPPGSSNRTRLALWLAPGLLRWKLNMVGHEQPAGA